MLCNLSIISAVLFTLAGVCLDLRLGEARRWHPLVGFGAMAIWIEKKLNGGRFPLLSGAVAWMLAVLPAVLLTYAGLKWSVEHSVWLNAGLHVSLLYFALGLRSLRDHVLPIQQALQDNNLSRARTLTGRIVSRDTSAADNAELAKAGVESLLENGNDAVFGTIFWFVVAGGSGALLFRLANTLDAMWGYKTTRYLRFGKVAAHVDDVMNWIPARLTALSYALLGNTLQTLNCWRTQAPLWPSPNAGPVIAAGAGALNLALGKAATYEGEAENRPALGMGQQATAQDIGRAWQLILHSAILWLTVLIATAVIFQLRMWNA